MSTQLEKRIHNCNVRLDALFQDVKFNSETKKQLIENQLKHIKDCYQQFYKGNYGSLCISAYERFIEQLEWIKKGYTNKYYTPLDIINFRTQPSLYYTMGYVFLLASLCFVNPLLVNIALSISGVCLVFAIVDIFLKMKQQSKAESLAAEEIKRENNIFSFFRTIHQEKSYKTVDNEASEQFENTDLKLLPAS